MKYKDEKITLETLIDKVDNYIKDDSINLINEAFHIAYNYHEGKKRLNGDDQIVHSLSVAHILADINSDIDTIVAGILHDTLEEDDSLESVIEESFGKEVLKLIKGVTVINKLSFSGDKKAIIESHRKILVGLCEDVRVIIIKMADRLHNMRTLWALSKEGQKSTAKETLDILVPIASRLGMNNFKSEFEDLCLRYLKPDTYFYIVEKLNQTKTERENILNEMINEISKILEEEHIEFKIKGRAKSIYSIYKKLDKGRSFDDIYDFLALRVYVEHKHECYQVLGAIHGKFTPIPKRFKDYVARPKTNMYQSIHTTVFGVHENIFEIQIRTYEMDLIAENGIASHWSYKEKGSEKTELKNNMDKKLQFFRSLLEMKDESNADEEFLKSIQEEVLKENIYVFTPKGDVVELPYGSTPIDFAYRVHSGVGDKMVGAIVNDKIVTLDYQLKNNDIVKIKTNQNSVGPSKEWMNMAFTSSAKNKIKAFFNRIDKEDNYKLGKKLIMSELRKRKISNNDFIDNIDKIVEELKLSNEDELYIAVGSSKITVGSVINTMLGENISKEEMIYNKIANTEIKETKPQGDILVEGIENIKVHIASCCKPIPGDNIVGYITKGSGISVHRSMCPNVSELEERIIDVKWNNNTTMKYPVLLSIRVMSGKNVFLDIISKTSNSDIIVQSLNNINIKDETRYDIVILVGNLEKLNKFMNELRSIHDILEVERIIK